jgi:tetratricopeptide (TPR) repeat protein
MTLALAVVLSLLPIRLQQDPDEVQVRTAVQQYYDAQSQRDPDKCAAFWSVNANPRMSRDAFVAMFGEPAEDSFTVDVRAVELKGTDARVRVAASRTRLIMRDTGPVTLRTTFLNSQIWRKEAGSWKLLRDGPFAEEIADDLIAAAPADRAALYDKQAPADLVQARLAISQRATMAITLGKNYVRGKQLFELALDVSRAARDRRGEMNSLHNIAQADYFLRDLAAATETYGKELAVAREVDDQDAIAAAQFGLATVAYSRAEYTPALELYREALTVYERRDDPSAIGRTIVSIGNVQYLQGEYDEAAASYRRGLALALDSSDRAGATFARRGLGRVLAAQGDVATALDMYAQVLTDERAAFQADPRLKSNVGAALENVGELYYRLGNTDQARAAFTEARALDEDDPESAGRVLAARGLTELVAGRFDAAFAAYGDSRAKFEASKNPDGIARAWVGIGFSQTAREKFADAVAAYRTAIGLFEQKQNPDGVARAWLGMSRAQSGAGDHAAALESAGKVSTIAAALKSDDLGWRGAERRGEVLCKLERYGDARQAFEQATAAIGRLVEEAPISAEARGQLEDSASAWAGLAITMARQGDASAALRAMEARRAHMRRLQLAAFQHDIVRGMTPEEIADEQSVVREIVSTRAQLNAEAHAARRDPDRSRHLGEQLTSLVAKRGEQQARVYARLPDLAVWRGLPQPALDAASVNDLVPTGKGLLVAYVLDEDELLTVSVARGENGPDIAAVVTPFDRRLFADAVAAAMQPAVLQDGAEWRKRAAPLGAALLQPLGERLAVSDRLVIVPDDLLWKVPFDALPWGDADLASNASVTYATSLAALRLQGRTAAATSADRPVSGFLAAPSIPDATRAQLRLTLPSWTPQDPAAALASAQADAKPYGQAATLRSGSDASESSARTLLATTDVVHVQAPLQVSATAPVLSSILLAASGDSPAEDGRFEARDWFSLTARAHVVLLTDGSSFGVAGVGAAMDTLAWSAAAAGVSTLIVGRWPAEGFTPDSVAAAFHAKLAGGESAGAAWRAAVASGRENGAPPSAWAGLRLIGALTGGGS